VWGSAFTGLRMLEDPIVLVTMNYRKYFIILSQHRHFNAFIDLFMYIKGLGVLGALNLGTDKAPGKKEFCLNNDILFDTYFFVY
jgi:hypothetical protein